MKVDFQKFLFAVLLIILVYLVAPPLFFTVRSSLYVTKGFGHGTFSFKNYADVLSTEGTTTMLFNSLCFAIGSSLIALVFGTLLAWIVERTSTPFKKLIYLASFASFAIPGIIQVIGWILLLGPEAGLINVWHWLRGYFGPQWYFYLWRLLSDPWILL